MAQEPPIPNPSIQADAAVDAAAPPNGAADRPEVSWPDLLATVSTGGDLSREAAAGAMAAILDGAATDAQIAGLIVGLRIKGEAVEEMTGLVVAMLDVAEALSLPADAIDIVGTGGSAHRRSHALNVSTMSSVVAASAGAVVCKHGNRRASSTSGSFDFLEALGVRAELPGPELAVQVDKIGVGFAYARVFHPAMRHAGPVRAELGIPTVFNVLGPLAHPGRVVRQVVGVAADQQAAKMAAVLQNLGSERAWVVAGADGIDEIGITGPSIVYQVTPDRISRFEVDPSELGLSVADSLDVLAGGSAADNATIFRRILDGSERGPRRDVVVINAAAGLVVAGVVEDLHAGVTEVAAAIDDGRAAAKLDDLVAASPLT
ncbi:MAG: anthranilate phosphoribosyltransferase [Acidimicrobiales bacterium]